MIISKDLLREEKREDGYCQVVIRISHNEKNSIVRTDVYALENDWDSEIRRLTDADCDNLTKNEQIDSMYRRIAGHVQSSIDNLLDSNFEDILTPYYISEPNSEDNKPESKKIHFSDLVKKKVDSCVSFNTKRGYESFGRYILRRLENDPEIKDINQEFTNKFIEAIDTDYNGSESMRRFMFSRFNAVINLAKDIGDLPLTTRIQLPPYSLLPSVRNLSGEEIYYIVDAFIESMTGDAEIERKTTKALGLFVLDIAFQGLAPVDLANLKVKSLEFSTLHAIEKNPRRYEEDEAYRIEYESKENRMEVVTLSTTRKKTGRPVEVVASILGIEKYLRHLIKGKSPDDFLLDCFQNGKSYTSTQKQNRLANYFNKIAKYLNAALEDYYKRHNLGHPKRVTFYFARHAFCNLADNLDVPRHIIQDLVGHRSSVLETNYLRPISRWEQAMVSHKLLSHYFSETDS